MIGDSRARPPASSVMYADPIAMQLLEKAPGLSGVGSLGVMGEPVSATIAVASQLANAYKSIRKIFSGGSPDQAKAIWNAVPASLIRVTGGHGKWTDPVTGETFDDAGTDVRKGAVVASALGMYNDKRNWWFDDATGQHVSPGVAAARWNALFGPVSFSTAYQQNPSLFRVFGSDETSGDPVIPDMGGMALDASQSTAQHLSANAPGGVPSSPGNIVHSGTSQASIFGGSPLLLAGAAVLAFLVLPKMFRKRR